MKRTFTLLIIGVALFVACKQRPVINSDVVLPIVTTGDVVSISSTVAICVGTVTDDGDGNILARGICWGTSKNPTIDGWHTSDGTGTGSFTSYMINLNTSNVYYIRAYATNEAGTAYGEQKTLPVFIPTGAVEGLYSVSETQKVWFSRGNLQYNTETSVWRFAEHQYDYVGDAYNSENNKWIDLFGWGTSGYAHGAVCYQPTSTSTDNNSYIAYGNYSQNLYDFNGKADWGYNAISNGGNVENIWRTLTKDEWKYLISTRTTPSGIRFAKAEVNGVNGFILLPDSWIDSYYNLAATNTTNANYNINEISEEDWTSIFETNGAVFLPAAGLRTDTTLSYLNTSGYYWSSDYCSNGTAYGINVSNSVLMVNGYSRYSGRSVRLVHNVD